MGNRVERVRRKVGHSPAFSWTGAEQIGAKVKRKVTQLGFYCCHCQDTAAPNLASPSDVSGFEEQVQMT